MNKILLIVLIFLSSCSLFTQTPSEEPSVKESVSYVSDNADETIVSEEEIAEYISDGGEKIDPNGLFNFYIRSGEVRNENIEFETFNRLLQEYVDDRSISSGKYRNFRTNMSDDIDEKFLHILNNFNSFDFSSYPTALDFIESGISEKGLYNWNSGYYIWNYNQENDYLFSIDTAYEITGMCLVLNDTVGSVTTFNGESLNKNVIEGKDTYLSSRFDDFSEELAEVSLDDIIKGNYSDELSDLAVLIFLAHEYVIENNSAALDVFYKEFFDRLSVEFSYNEFSAYLLTRSTELGKTEICDDLYQYFFTVN